MKRRINENGVTICHIQDKDKVLMQVRPNIFWKDVTVFGKAAMQTNKIDEMIIPFGVERIESEAFSFCRHAIKSVHIPSSVTFIGEKAFEGCKNITNFSMSIANTTIASNAFANSSIERVINSINKGVMFRDITVGSFAMVVTEEGCKVFGFESEEPDFRPFIKK